MSDEGLPRGMKVLFGCLGVIALGLVATAVAVGVPPENLRTVQRYRDVLPAFESEEPGRATVLAVATLWGMTEPATWSAPGLDTLGRR